ERPVRKGQTHRMQDGIRLTSTILHECCVLPNQQSNESSPRPCCKLPASSTGVNKFPSWLQVLARHRLRMPRMRHFAGSCHAQHYSDAVSIGPPGGLTAGGITEHLSHATTRRIGGPTCSAGLLASGSAFARGEWAEFGTTRPSLRRG